MTLSHRSSDMRSSKVSSVMPAAQTRTCTGPSDSLDLGKGALDLLR